MIHFNITLAARSVEEALTWAKQIQDSGYNVAVNAPKPNATGYVGPNYQSEEEKDLRAKYKEKFSKGFKRTQEQMNQGLTPVECMKAILDGIVQPPSENEGVEEEQTQGSGEQEETSVF